MQRHIAVIGATGGIGSALVEAYLADASVAIVHACSRNPLAADTEKLRWHTLDLTVPDSIASAAQDIAGQAPLDAVLIATGTLWGEHYSPEKSFTQLDAAQLGLMFAINATGPALVMKHFLPLLHKDRPVMCAALSARVGSISDNRLGGWHSYRASKAALNMLIKGAAIEQRRINPQSVVAGLHPGTVDTRLSAPFQGRVKPEQLFSARQSALHLMRVIESLTPADSGGCFAWDGKPVPP